MSRPLTDKRPQDCGSLTSDTCDQDEGVSHTDRPSASRDHARQRTAASLPFCIVQGSANYVGWGGQGNSCARSTSSQQVQYSVPQTSTIFTIPFGRGPTGYRARLDQAFSSGVGLRSSFWRTIVVSMALALLTVVPKTHDESACSTTRSATWGGCSTREVFSGVSWGEAPLKSRLRDPHADPTGPSATLRKRVPDDAIRFSSPKSSTILF